MDRRSKHLSNEDRGVIHAEHGRGSSQQAIGLVLGRSASTICRELARGRQADGTCCPSVVRRVYDDLRARCRRMRRLIEGGILHRFVHDHLVYRRWSDKQFVGLVQHLYRWTPENAAFLFRWHTRAFCLTDGAFQDFLLSRMLETRGARASGVPAQNDRDWDTRVTFEIGRHPALSDTQAKVIALDYGMRGGKTKINVRRALLYYALRRLGLDTDPGARKPQDQQIVPLNREAIHEDTA